MVLWLQIDLVFLSQYVIVQLNVNTMARPLITIIGVFVYVQRQNQLLGYSMERGVASTTRKFERKKLWLILVKKLRTINKNVCLLKKFPNLCTIMVAYFERSKHVFEDLR